MSSDYYVEVSQLSSDYWRSVSVSSGKIGCTDWYYEMFCLYKDVDVGQVTLGSMNFSPNFSPNRAGVDYTLLRANRH